MRRSARRTGCLLGVAILGLSLLTALFFAAYTPEPRPLRVAAWMPTSWDAERARASWLANRHLIDELSPVWYQVGAAGDGSLVRYSGACDVTLITEAHDSGALVLPLVNNAYGGVFDPALVSAVLHDPALRAAHITALVDEMLACGYDGIDIDYESLGGMADREAFSLFVEELAAALHAQGRLLAVTVHPKTAEPGNWAGPQAQDWARIGAAADRLRVMAYGYHWEGSGPGPIAPLFWMEDVVRFARRQVEPHKVYLGLHLYALDWSAAGTTARTWEGVQPLAAAPGAERQWVDQQGWRQTVAEPRLIYTADGVQHEVWYADGTSIAVRLSMVRRYGLGGVAFWRLGGEDPACWTALSN
jgi:spore germination protein